MSILSRLGNLMHAEANSATNAMEDHSRSKLLDLSYEQLQDQLRAAKASLATVVAQRITLDGRVAQAQAWVDHALANAKEAVSKGRDDLAKEFLRQKQSADAELVSTTQSRDAVAAQEQSLENSVRQLEERVQQFGTAKDVTKAQLAASRAQMQVSQSLSGVGSTLSSAGEQLQRAQAQAESMQNQAKAMDELTQKGILEDPLDHRTAAERELAALRTTSSVDDELAALKAQTEGPAKA